MAQYECTETVEKIMADSRVVVLSFYSKSPHHVTFVTSFWDIAVCSLHCWTLNFGERVGLKGKYKDNVQVTMILDKSLNPIL